MPAHWWASGVLAGKDLEAGGTWLGVGRQRFALITNYRDLDRHKEGCPSRGLLVSDFIEDKESLGAFKFRLKTFGKTYNPFNMLFYEHKTNSMMYYSNIEDQLKPLEKGFYVLSNHLLNSPWPKTERLKDLLSQFNAKNPSPHQLFEILSDTQKPSLEDLPQTGLSQEWELQLSSIFVASETYGTRFQSIFVLEESGIFSLYERALDHTTGNWDYQSFQSDFNDLMIT